MTLRLLDLFSGTGGASQAFLDRGHHVTRIDNDPQFADVPHTYLRDVMLFDVNSPASMLFDQDYDVIWASPPCQAFSLAATGTHMWARGTCGTCKVDRVTKQHERWVCRSCEEGTLTKGSLYLEPKTDFGKLSVSLVERTLELIDTIKPTYYWIENPNGGMIHFIPESIPRVQTTFCRYGESRQKLTNLWGNWPDAWTPRPRCKNGAACPECHGVGATDHADDGTFGVECERCGGSGKCHEPAPRGAKTGTQGIKGAVARAAIPYELSLEICLAVEEDMA